MRIIFIDPKKRKIEEREARPTLNELQSLCGGFVTPHWMVSNRIDGHIGLVDEDGTMKQKTLWFFNSMPIYGPMIIMGGADQQGNQTPATVPLHIVKDFVIF